jgi:hypothetical protein
MARNLDARDLGRAKQAAQLVAAPDAESGVLGKNRTLRGLRFGNRIAPGAQVNLVLGPEDHPASHSRREAGY